MLIDPPRVGRAKAVVKAALIARYRLRNRVSRAPVTGECPVVVSLTSYGERLDIVAHAIESIAAGSVRPARLILWVDEPGFTTQDRPMLQRLEQRGLEILPCDDLGPHKKYFPYSQSAGSSPMPLVTADDDILYPRRWLAELWQAHEQTPQDFVGHRAVTIESEGEALAPYATWRPATSTTASHRTFVTGGAGVVYPRELLLALRDRGTAFLDVSPRADDVWINAVAVSAGIRARWTGDMSWAWSYPRSQANALHHENASQGGNDVQIERAYGEAEIAAVVAEAT